MKIAIPVDENKTGTSVCLFFARAPYFIIHDTQTGQTEYVSNTAADAQSGAGIKTAQFIVDIGTDILLTVRCGQNAADVLNAADVKVYKTSGGGAKEVLADFAKGKLTPMAQFNAGFHGRR